MRRWGVVMALATLVTGCDLLAAYHSGEAIGLPADAGDAGDVSDGSEGDVTVADLPPDTPAPDMLPACPAPGMRVLVPAGELSDVVVHSGSRYAYAVGHVQQAGVDRLLIVALDDCGRPLASGVFVPTSGSAATLLAQSVAVFDRPNYGQVCVGGSRVSGSAPEGWVGCFELAPSGAVLQERWSVALGWGPNVRVGAANDHLIVAGADSSTLKGRVYSLDGTTSKELFLPIGTEVGDVVVDGADLYFGYVDVDAGTRQAAYSTVPLSCTTLACPQSGQRITAVAPPSTLTAFGRGAGFTYWFGRDNTAKAADLVVFHVTDAKDGVRLVMPSSLMQVNDVLVVNGRTYIAGRGGSGRPVVGRSLPKVSGISGPSERSSEAGEVRAGALISGEQLLFVGKLETGAGVEVCTGLACIQPPPP
ncbi:MAG: hypothetical protein KC503_45635 [Myxococcales bacterium]|nr:hypothetical protein [Myxococcales bacterium]